MGLRTGLGARLGDARTGDSVQPADTDEDGKAVQAEAFPLRQATALLESALQEFVTPDDLAAVEQREADLYERLMEEAKWIDQEHGDRLR